MQFSILHLSDLHRDLTDEIPNTWLIDSIERDLKALAAEYLAVPKPSICVVSGDLVYGVSPSAPKGERELERQNRQSLEFLIELANRLYDGERERVVILPGNHDIAFQRVMKSVALVPPPSSASEKGALIREYFAPNTRLRWSWQEMSFYRIVDTRAYESRLLHFCNLYDEFYAGHRTYPLDVESQYDLFDFPDLKLSIVALNSCYENDPWQRAGRINSTALASACRKLRSPSRFGWLLAAAWHHNLVGGPSQNDYLDPGFVQLLIDSGVSLGLHGHQHRSEWFDERYRLGPKTHKMTIISAATLCAGPANLSPGSPRGYNVIELNNQTWAGRLHQRMMVNLQFSTPVWGPGHFVDTNQSYVSFELSPPSDARPANLDARLALETADSHLGRGEWKEAIDVLRNYGHDPMARRMLLKAVEEINDPALTIEMLKHPQENSEAVILGFAILSSDDPSARGEFLQDPFVVNSTDASVKEIVEKLRVRAAR